MLVLGRILVSTRKFWHQFLRQRFPASSFATHDMLCLSRPSPLEQYTNVLVVFFLFGLLHVMIDLGQCVPLRYLGSLHHLLPFVLGVMVRGSVQAQF